MPAAAPSARAAGAARAPRAHAVPERPVLVVMGVSGVGKSTLGAGLAARLGWRFEEGDALHPEVNVAKMAAGHPLTDDDRDPWLQRIAAWIDSCVVAGEPGVVTCSALKRRYRDILRRPEVVFVHLTGPGSLTAERLAGRTGHFMPATLLDSQLDSLEAIDADESAVELSTALPPDEQLEAVLDWIGMADSQA